MGKPQNSDLQLRVAIICILTRGTRKSTLGSQVLHSRHFSYSVYSEVHFYSVIQLKNLPTEATYYDNLM